MKITLKTIKVRELVRGYKDSQEQGIVGYNGKLDIRPAYQREFVYKDKQRDAVIATVRKNFPLNMLYWVVDSDDDNKFEVLDGQQRTISICQYVTGVYSINHQFFHNLTGEEQEQILNYELLVYLCQGEERQKLDWFNIINTGGEKLTKQELRNSVYTGAWLADAKMKFSRTGCAAYQLGKDHVSGSPIRQDFLEQALDWISDGNIETYMATHQHDRDASDLWNYFDKVMTWTKMVFPLVRREMKSIPWGTLYNSHKDKVFNPVELETKLGELFQDDEVTKKAGSYLYLITGEEKHLSTRVFSKNQALSTYTKQQGTCPCCNNHFKLEEMQADHIVPWSKGGKTTPDNCQMLCRKCNQEKSNK